MKKSYLLPIASGFVALFCWALPVSAAVSPVNFNSMYVASGIGHSLTLTGVTTGNLLVLGFNSNNTGCASLATTTPTDSAGNAYAFIASSSAGTFDCNMLWYAKNVTGSASLTVNVSSSASIQMAVTLSQFSGVDTASPFETSTIKTGTTATLTTNAYSTASANDLVVGLGGNFNAAVTFTAGTTAGTAMTINASSTAGGGAAAVNITQEYLVASGILSGATTSINFGGTQARGDLIVAAFKPTASAPAASAPVDSLFFCSE